MCKAVSLKFLHNTDTQILGACLSQGPCGWCEWVSVWMVGQMGPQG